MEFKKTGPVDIGRLLREASLIGRKNPTPPIVSPIISESIRPKSPVDLAALAAEATAGDRVTIGGQAVELPPQRPEIINFINDLKIISKNNKPLKEKLPENLVNNKNLLGRKPKRR